MTDKIPVAIVDLEAKQSPLPVVVRFKTIKAAENWIAQEAKRNPAKVLRGGYAIDAPELMVNPPKFHP